MFLKKSLIFFLKLFLWLYWHLANRNHFVLKQEKFSFNSRLMFTTTVYATEFTDASIFFFCLNIFFLCYHLTKIG